MARIKLVYIGGGSTRAPGTLAAFVRHAAHFAGSEIVLVDLDREKLALVERLGRRLIAAAGVDLRLTATTDRQAALTGADAVLTSFRPGGFEARRLDELIPLKYGVIGQETQGPGGFFMALRSIAVFQVLVAEMERLCPQAWLINYTNPVNLVSEAVTHHSPLRIVSLCEGPIYFPRETVAAAGLDPALLDSVMIGLNHACWSVRHTYAGQDVIPLLQAAYDRVLADPALSPARKRMVELACVLGSLPAAYFQYYYYQADVLAELRAAPRSRAEVILDQAPGYWRHYAEEAEAEQPVLEPRLSRGGLLELELAVEVLAAIVDDQNLIYPCNVPNQGAIPTFPADRVVEVPCLVNRHGATPLAQPPLPRAVAGLVEMLGEYQVLAAEAGWSGGPTQAVRALASNPLVLDVRKAQLLYTELAAAHRAYLPERLLP
jgi:6-phospho-beta-glucosidase